MLITPLCPCLGRREFLSVAADAINARATDDGSVIVKKQEQKQDAKKPKWDTQTEKALQAEVKSHSLSRLAGVVCQFYGACRLDQAQTRIKYRCAR